MPKKPLGKPPSQRPGHRSGGAHRQKPLNYDGQLIDVTYVKTLSPRSPEPVVLVINADDEVGNRLACEILGPERVQEIAADYRGRPNAATIQLGVEESQGAAAMLSFQFPNAKADLDQPLPAGHYRVVIVDGGVMTCRSRPIPKFEITPDNTLWLNP
jgi:hypothetical protein